MLLIGAMLACLYAALTAGTGKERLKWWLVLLVLIGMTLIVGVHAPFTGPEFAG